MEISRRKVEGITVIAVKGIIRLSESGQRFSQELDHCLTTESGPLLLDLSGVDEVDSNGIGELVGYLQRYEQAGRVLGIVHPSPRINKMLSFTRLDQVFRVFETFEIAMHAIAAASR